MFLARTIGWPEIALTLLMTSMLGQGFSRSEAASDSNKDGVPPFVIKNEIKKMQEILRSKGHFRGEINGVFGLRTRASIRAYQKAENLPISGQVDTRTAGRLGLRPESNWATPKNSGYEIGQDADRAGGAIRRDKPSAGIRRPGARGSKASGKEVSRVTGGAQHRVEDANNKQAENKEHDQ
jgi:peptidoglycan hydrolase-like protein with peptidoglycan-binding domain